MQLGFHPYMVVFFLMFVVGSLLPIVVGFFWVRPDADSRGQPGLIWAVLTIPFAWVAVLVYVIVRSLTPPAPVR
ncbi:MAG TPA: hypothetical protein VF040_08815 [Ktedonobacterales bacterium]